MEPDGRARGLYNLQSLWKSHRGNEPGEPSAVVPFLQLPLELVFLIAEFLTPLDLVLLSQSCRCIRAILGKRSSANFSRTDYFTYLARVARALPEQWVCDICMTLHLIEKLDTPTSQYIGASCPIRCGAYASLMSCSRTLDIRIQDYHVQLALKYTRLQQRAYNTYLQGLLEPCYQIEMSNNRGVPHTMYYSACPRVITGNDGNFRFLLFSTWRYLGGSMVMHLDHLRSMVACPHLLLPTIDEALRARHDDEEMTGACPRCATDFALKFHSGYSIVQAWQDFGSENSPVDILWRFQVKRFLDDLECLNSPWSWPPPYHEPGSIRDLYCYGPEPKIQE